MNVCVVVLACNSYNFTDAMMYFQLAFPFFCCVLRRKLPWFLIMLGRGGVGFDMQVYSMHWLKELVNSVVYFVHLPIVYY